MTEAPARERAARWLRRALWVLLVPALPFGVLALLVGIIFGFNLFRADRPWLTVQWLCIVLLPVPMILALRYGRHSPAWLALAVGAACAVMGRYAATHLV